MGSLWVLQFPPTVQTHAGYLQDIEYGGTGKLTVAVNGCLSNW